MSQYACRWKPHRHAHPRGGGGVLTLWVWVPIGNYSPPLWSWTAPGFAISKFTAPSFHGSSRTAPSNCHFPIHLLFYFILFECIHLLFDVKSLYKQVWQLPMHIHNDWTAPPLQQFLLATATAPPQSGPSRYSFLGWVPSRDAPTPWKSRRVDSKPQHWPMTKHVVGLH